MMDLQTMRRAALQNIETLSMLYENLETEAGIRSLYHSIDGKISMLSLLDIITAQEVNTLTECNIDRQQAALRKIWIRGMEWKRKNHLNSVYGHMAAEDAAVCTKRPGSKAPGRVRWMCGQVFEKEG